MWQIKLDGGSTRGRLERGGSGGAGGEQQGQWCGSIWGGGGANRHVQAWVAAIWFGPGAVSDAWVARSDQACEALQGPRVRPCTGGACRRHGSKTDVAVAIAHSAAPGPARQQRLHTVRL